MTSPATRLGATTDGAPDRGAPDGSSSSPASTLRKAVEQLASCQAPYLIGIRHHSPAIAAVLPALLDELAPECVLVELPVELGEWLGWLADPGTVAPVALAAGQRKGGLAFYPFADFSPELAAIRWAAARGVLVEPIDLPVSSPDSDEDPGTRLHVPGRPDDDELWDTLVEARAPGCSPEAVRRAGLAFGSLCRVEAAATPGGIGERDRRREEFMSTRVRTANSLYRVVVAVVGAFHAPALAGRVADRASAGGSRGRAAGPEALAGASTRPHPPETAVAGGDVVTSFVPYSFDRLDSRSGYPAGIRDPEWQQLVWQARGDPEAIEAGAAKAITAVVAEIRRLGHPAGVPEAREALRVALDLACLRGAPAPGRRELLEALETVLVQAEPLGRGRAVARALERVFVGRRQGRLPAGTPSSGLLADVVAELTDLRLPGPASDGPSSIRLDPLRSPLDRRRQVALRRLAACGVPYATLVSGPPPASAPPDHDRGPLSASERGQLTFRWQLAWEVSTPAFVERAGIHGVTLEQASGGSLLEADRQEAVAGVSDLRAATTLLDGALACDLEAIAPEAVSRVGACGEAVGSLGDALVAVDLLERFAAGLLPGLRSGGELAARATAAASALVDGGLRQVDTMAGSEDLAEAKALGQLARRVSAEEGGRTRLCWSLGRIDEEGSPMMQGAALLAQLLLSRRTEEEVGELMASHVFNATRADLRRELADRMRGALVVGATMVESSPALLDPVVQCVEDLGDRDFLDRLPALRIGFDVLAAPARRRLMSVLSERLGAEIVELSRLESSAHDLALWARADAAGREALTTADPSYRLRHPPTSPDSPTPWESPAPVVPPEGPAAADRVGAADGPDADPAGVTAGAVRGVAAIAPPGDAGEGHRAIGSLDRWRLVLGQEPGSLSSSCQRLGHALDEMYGNADAGGVATDGPGGGGDGPEDGSGEGANGAGAGGDTLSAGWGGSVPTAREWTRELEALFGPEIRDEVVAAAIERGRLDLALDVEPETLRPSVELLHGLLALAGGLSEGHLGRLRRLVSVVVDALVRQLATEVRSALAGPASNRVTRRKGGPVDLRRTLAVNLANVRPKDDGSGPEVVADRVYFREPSRRGLRWRVVLVVDVSGSMELCVIHAALMAAVVAALPAVTAHFVAFSTEAIDLSGVVEDPLALLLGVRVGGGTDIAAGLAYAGSLVTVPSRTMIVLVSDFAHGGSMKTLLAEVRKLAESGCRLLGLASLNATGAPSYAVGVAEQMAAAGMAVAALTPLELARWVGEQMR